MGFHLDTSDITMPYPAPSGTAFRVSYRVTNDGPDDPGHHDHVQVWDGHGNEPVNEYVDAPPSVAGGTYGVFVDLPALAPGYYDIAINLPDGTAAGATIVVQ
jgi:hypothetical protein